MASHLNECALITGASSGIGAEFAEQLAAIGYDLILVARHADRLDQIAASIQQKNKVKITVLPADLCCEPDIERVLSFIGGHPTIDMLVNNAGFGTIGRFYKLDPQTELRMLHVHMVASVMFSRAVLPGMVDRDHGVIINVSSLAGLLPIRNVLYGSSKAFLVKFSEALADELRRTKIKVQVLCPGFVLTEFHDTPELERFSRQSIPGFLWMTPQQVVRASLAALKTRRIICIPGRLYGFVGILARNSISYGLIVRVARLFFRWRRYSRV